MEYICKKYQIGEKIVFNNLNFDKISLNSFFYMDKKEYTITKHGCFSIGERDYEELYLDKELILQSVHIRGQLIEYRVFKVLKKYFLKNSMDKLFWFGGKEERGMMFFNDYFWGRDPWEFFGDFFKEFVYNYFPNIIDMKELSYEVEEAYCTSNIISLLIEKNIDIEEIQKKFQNELLKREWIIDYVFEDDKIEIYYHFNENELEKSYEFIRNASYILDIHEKNISYDETHNSSLFVRKVYNEFFNKEYLALVYFKETSMINVFVGIPIDESNFMKGE